MAWLIYDDAPIKAAYERSLPMLYTPEQDVAVVSLNLKPNDSDLRTERHGLAVANGLAQKGVPMVLHSFESEESLYKDDRFVLLMSIGNVVFVRDPPRLLVVVDACKRVETAAIKDPLAVALFTYEIKQRIGLSTLSV